MLQKANRRLLAVLLLLPFLQKMGLELWLHLWLHESHEVVYVSPRLSHGDKQTSYPELAKARSFISCHCVDDTLMPIVGEEGFQLEAPLFIGPILPITVYAAFHSSTPPHRALRGPPASLYI